MEWSVWENLIGQKKRLAVSCQQSAGEDEASEPSLLDAESYLLKAECLQTRRIKQ